MAIKTKAVIYLRRDGIDYFVSDRPDLLHLKFPPEAVVDVEIIDREQLVTALDNFIITNKLAPSRLTILLSDAILFQKDIPITTDVETEAQIKAFISNVPFEHVGSITVVIDKNKRVIATNCDLYSIIQTIFEKHNFQMALIAVPESFDKNFVVGDHVTVDQAHVIFQKMDSFKPTDNFLEQPKQVVDNKSNFVPAATPKKKPAKSTLPLLLPLFGVLLAILGVVYYMQTKQNVNPVAQAVQNTPPPLIPTEIPTVQPSPTISTESVIDANKEIKIQILNGSGIVGQAENGRKQLSTLGFENVATGNAPGSATKTLLIFKQSVPEAVRAVIVTELQKTYQEISTQETNDSEYDVLITLGNILNVPSPTVSTN